MRYSYGRLRSARIRLRAAGAAVLAVSVLASAGCGSESHAAKDQTIDLSKLDTGSYATKPTDATTSDPMTTGRELEAVRLANIFPLGSEIDPALIYNTAGTNVFTEANSFNDYVNVDHFTDDAKGFIAGFATSARPAQDPDLGYTLTNAAMVFDTDADAGSAATALARSGLKLKSGTEVDPVQSTKHPASQILWAPSQQRLASWTPIGKFVLFTMIDQAENYSVEQEFGLAPEPMPLTLADKAIDVTADRLKDFQTTPPDKLTGLPLDPDGMLRLTLQRPTGDQTTGGFPGTLNQHGMLHMVENLTYYRTVFDQTGVDRVSDGAGFLVRARDSASAQAFLDNVSVTRTQHPIDPPAELPIARCEKSHGPDPHAAPFHCYVAFGRYAATVWSQQLQDAYQRISAQYAILANNK
ncbi:hypothetical protein [Nocardia sp. NPDC020380]|uniref:DUF7373 family lipoprotein n=1 Tax=Nocardia sp. NPDC020380 TaxID=3364309 RepID=UPI00379F224B